MRWMKLQHYSPTTIKEYNRELTGFIDYLEAEDLELEDLQLIDIEDFVFSHEVGERAKNRTLSTVKSFFNYLCSRGILAKNPAKDVKLIKIKRKNPVFLQEEEYSSALHPDWQQVPILKILFFQSLKKHSHLTVQELF